MKYFLFLIEIFIVDLILVFPALSLSALREYRPTLMPQSPSASTARSDQEETGRRAMTKSEFIWEQSIVSSET